ncbi:flagellar biosynthesis protein FlhA [Caulobacter hibisci]|uniref:FHIPEP family type III secretion protein n=1 Tax=Caulobacter hibisci TaxID=2035993 RepID=A0ABS0ST39_9CAUL|nr:flagellar biosynthesis protein FlhA [Caulobacter hibisci]MBI1682721.1 FHIPEP family type III secretion protein [Caulobacter hibisci]
MSVESYLKRLQGRPRQGVVARFSDLFLVAGVVAIVALMILPLPALALDALVAINICFGVMLLLVAIYISTIVEFSVFPSLLLITTLYRLALSIATTRMILIEGHAGHIIDTFGTLVAGGNLVVGLVVFLIITVVQFIVIAKGAERVAEVAARFSLDAMPGKQLSIDSDLRSGMIDKDEAKRRRRVLEMESKLHGSLDGAMKFVKGDAIASIIIVVINLLGGLAIGMLQQGLEFGAAIHKYSILTIGDGMVTQIPALLGAMAAGLIVTRTTDEDSESHLGDAMRRQFAAKPRVFLVAGGICWLMALVPGFPLVIFLLLGGAAIVTGALLDVDLRARLTRKIAPARAAADEAKASPAAARTRIQEAQPVVPLLLELDGDNVRRHEGAVLTRGLEEVLEEFELRLGVALPRASFHYGEGVPGEGRGAPRWRLLAFEAPIGAGELSHPADLSELQDAVRQALRRNAGLFVGIQEASNLLTRAGADYPEVVKEAARALPLARIAEVMRRLAEEEVPLRNQRDILEALADAGQREKDPFALTEFARVALRRQISHRYAPDGALKAVVLEPPLEQHLREAIRTGGGAQQLALDPDMARRVTDAILDKVDESGASVVLAAIDLRRHVRKLVEARRFDLGVLSFHELLPTLKLDVAGRVAFPREPLSIVPNDPEPPPASAAA